MTVSADVKEILSPTSFVIAGTEDTAVEPLLIVGAYTPADLAEGGIVEVTGTVHQAFEVATVEDELGVDLDDALVEAWDGEPYLEAIRVDSSVPPE